MAERYALDTNIVIAIQRSEPSVLEKLDELSSFYLPTAVVGELYFGAFKSRSTSANILRLEVFLAQFPMLELDRETTERFGGLKAELHGRGKMIPINDLWIAAQCRQYDLTLITRDAHFAHVPELTVDTW